MIIATIVGILISVIIIGYVLYAVVSTFNDVIDSLQDIVPVLLIGAVIYFVAVKYLKSLSGGMKFFKTDDFPDGGSRVPKNSQSMRNLMEVAE